MLSSVGFSFSSAKRGWFLDRINFLTKEKGVSKTEISNSLNIFKSRLSKIINDKNSIVQDSLVDSLISTYAFQNPINDSKARQSFSKAKRNWFVSKINFLKQKKGLSYKDLCEIFDIFPSRLSYMLNKPDSPINDKYIDLLVEKFDFGNPVFYKGAADKKTEEKENDGGVQSGEVSSDAGSDSESSCVEGKVGSREQSGSSVAGQMAVCPAESASVSGADFAGVLLDRILALQSENTVLKQRLAADSSTSEDDMRQELERLRQRNAFLENKLAKWRDLFSDLK